MYIDRLNFVALKFVAISIFLKNKKLKMALSLEFVSLRKKNNSPLLLLLNKCKLSCSISCRCPNLIYILNVLE
jgi:hypothetical protein